MAENLKELFCRFRPDGTLTSVSDSYCASLGKSRQELIGRSFFSLIAPDDQEVIQRHLGQLTPAKPILTCECRILRPEAEVRWQQWVDRAIYDEEGQLVELQAIGRDITDQKKAEEAMRRILEKVPAFIWKYRPATNQILYASDYVTELTGIPKNELSQNDGDLWFSRIDKNTVSQAALEKLHTAMEKGEPFEVTYIFHTSHKGPRWFYGIGRPAIEEGELFYYGHTTDITESRAAEESQTLLTSALEQAGEAIIITRLDGVIEYVNPAFERMTGYSREEVIGKNPNLLKSGRQDKAFYRDLWTTILKGETWRGRFINRRKDGSFYEQWATITPVRDVNGNIIDFVSVQLDMTHQLELEHKLRQAERLAAVGETIAGLAHYIKNIIHSLKGSAYLIDEALHKKDIETIEPMWDIYTRNSERLFTLTQQMLGYVRTRKLELEATDLNELIEDIYDSAAPSAAVRKVELRFEPGPDLPLIPCDKAAMHDALLNLVCNAVDACSDIGGGAVDVKTTHNLEKEYVEVTVEDNGPGIAPEHQQKIFEPFFSTKGSKGSGLGLAVVNKTVREHEGTIFVQSEPGRTVFTIRLPM